MSKVQSKLNVGLVGRVCVTVADTDRLHNQLDTAPGTSSTKRNDVAAITIDIHQVRIQMNEG